MKKGPNEQHTDSALTGREIPRPLAVTASVAPIPIVIIGAAGRMGLSLLRELPQFPEFRLHAAVVRPDSRSRGLDAGELAGATRMGITTSSHLEEALKGGGLALDFSASLAASRHLGVCATAGVPLLLGTTGLAPDLLASIAEASLRVPVLVAANTSLGAAVLQDLVRRAAAALGPGFDIHIHDTHHRHKRDAPSGTALALGDAITGAHSRCGPVEYTSVRGGDVVGEHEVQFLGNGERLRLCHVATNRAVFASGALRAGLWLARQEPGTYHMADMFKDK